MKMLRKTYAFQDEQRTLRIFGDEAAFRQHLKHFQNASEPWHTITSLRDLQTHCQKRSDSDVMIVYKLVAPVIDRGIKFACSHPLYVSYCESTAQRPGRRLKYLLLSNYGFLVVCDQKAVLSAYFKVRTRAASPRHCFEIAWHEIRLRCLAARYNQRNGARVQLSDVKWYNEHTWTTMPDWHTIAPADLAPDPPQRAAAFFTRAEQWAAITAQLKLNAP